MGKRSRLNRRQLSPEQTSYATRVVCAHEVDQGASLRETAQMMNCSHTSVSRYIKRFEETGDVERKKYTRENTCDTDESRQMLAGLVDEKNTETFGCPGFKWVFRTIEKNVLPCSLKTVRKILKSMGYITKVFSRKPILTPQHKENCLKLADYLEGLNGSQTSQIIWTDEKIFRCSLHGKKRTYLAKREDPPLRLLHKWINGMVGKESMYGWE